MDLKKIANIIGSNILDEHKESLIIDVLAEDENIVPTLLRIIESERRRRGELLHDTNLNLSRSLVALEDNIEGKQKNFVVQSIKEHYLKHKDYVKCIFQIKGLP